MPITKAKSFIFDPILMVSRVRDRYETTTNARHKQMLEQVLEHLEGEVEFDLDKLMNAYPVPEPQYRVWRDGTDVGPKGREAVLDDADVPPEFHRLMEAAEAFEEAET